MLCPHCGLPVHKAPEELLLLMEKLKLPRREYGLAMAILQDWPNPVSKSVIIKRMYSPQDLARFTSDATQSFYCHLARVKQKLRVTRWAIVKHKFRGWRFELDIKLTSKEVMDKAKVEAGKIRIDYQTP